MTFHNGDKDSRSEWEETYTKGLDQLGLKDRRKNYSLGHGACGVFHPMLSEAVITLSISINLQKCFLLQGPVRD